MAATGTKLLRQRFNVAPLTGKAEAADAMRRAVVDRISEMTSQIQDKQSGETRKGKSAELGAQAAVLFSLQAFLLDIEVVDEYGIDGAL